MHLNTFMRRAARINPRGVATEHEGTVRTWQQVADRVLRLAGAYAALGRGKGDAFALLAYNSDRYLESMFSVFAMGGVTVPLNTRLSPDEMAYCTDHSGATTLLADRAFLEQARALRRAVPAIEHLIVLDGPGGKDELAYEELAQHDAIPALPHEEADDIAGIFYTGGTTGRSKGVVLSHGNLVNNALNLQPHFGFSPDTRCLHVAPMFHIAEALSIFGVTMAAGQHRFIPKFDARLFMEEVERGRINFAGLIPTMLKRVVDHEDIASFDLASLKSLFYGGSPILESDLRRSIAALPHVAFMQGYGLTETSPTITVLEPRFHVFEGQDSGKTASVGRQVYSVDVAIMDESGRTLPTGESGEICVRGGTVMKGYWRDPDATAAAMHGDWFRTGDIGLLDGDAFLYVVDRAKDMIISGGENVYSIEVENVLSLHPDIVECAVIGVPDEDWGERVHAVVRLRGEANGHDIIGYCKQHLTGYKCPRSIDIRSEPLPLSAVGKISKKELKAQVAARTPQEAR